MADHVSEWLGAYHDDELHGARLRQVERHLTECNACQAKLDEIRSISNLLHSFEPVEDFLSAERFAANLALRLPRQGEPAPTHPALKTAWWLVPIGVLGIWLCVAITQSLSSLLTLGVDSGLLNGNLARLGGNPSQMDWFATALDLFNGQLGGLGLEILTWLNDANLFLVQLVGNLMPYVILGVGYLVWLAFWWLRDQGQPSQNVNR